MAAALRRGLRYEGIVADVTARGEEAVGLARATDYDAIVLDVMLPDIDGFETCPTAARRGSLGADHDAAARDAVEVRVRGLDQGADDYLTKPFSLAELLAALARTGAARTDRAGRWSDEVGDVRLTGDAPSPAVRPRSRCRHASSRCWRPSCATPGRCQPTAAARRGLGPRVRAALTWSRSTCATCARRSNGRSAPPRSRRCAGSRYRRRR